MYNNVTRYSVILLPCQPVYDFKHCIITDLFPLKRDSWPFAHSSRGYGMRIAEAVVVPMFSGIIVYPFRAQH